jgi:hypothetical protein
MRNDVSVAGTGDWPQQKNSAIMQPSAFVSHRERGMTRTERGCSRWRRRGAIWQKNRVDIQRGSA